MKLIYFVPGFCASHLVRGVSPFHRGEKIWLSQVDVAWSGIADLDTAADVSPIDLRHVRPDGILHEVYQPFLMLGNAANVPIIRAAYDWRADVATNGQRLADDLAGRQNQDIEVTVIGHSMGSLVAASMVNRLPDKMLAKVKRVIFCGTPWQGTFRTIQLFTGFHDVVERIVNLNRTFSRRSREAWRLEAVRVVASWPGAYDLLPMPDLLATYPPGPGQDFRHDATMAKVNPWFNIARYDEAVARRPIHVGFPPWITVHNFRGTEQDTFGPSPSMSDGRPAHYFQSLLGDGVVPEASSHAPQAFNAIRHDFMAEHEQFMNHWLVNVAIMRAMGVDV